MEKLKKFESFKNDNNEETLTMYHGTSAGNEKRLLENGWKPNMVSSGSEQGNPAYLYVSNTPEGAEWYASGKGNPESVLEIVNIPKSYLGIDPEEYISTDIDKELKQNTSFTIRKPLSKEHFVKYDGTFSITRGDDFEDFD